jgi:hypothetical protein
MLTLNPFYSYLVLRKKVKEAKGGIYLQAPLVTLGNRVRLLSLHISKQMY